MVVRIIPVLLLKIAITCLRGKEFEWMTIYTLNQRKNIVLGIIIALGVLIALSFRTIFTAVLGAIILYTLLKPLYINLTCKRKWPCTLSAVTLLLLSFIILVLPFFTVSVM